MMLFTWLARCFCLHTDSMVKREGCHWSMWCPQCGYETVGWELDQQQPRRTE